MLPDGTELTAVSFGSVDPYARDVPPDFGLYFDERWRPPWPHEYLNWPDYGVPDDPTLVVVALELLLNLGLVRANVLRWAVTAVTVAPVRRLPVLPSSAAKHQAKQSAGSACRVLRTCGRDRRARGLRRKLQRLTRAVDRYLRPHHPRRTEFDSPVGDGNSAILFDRAPYFLDLAIQRIGRVYPERLRPGRR